MRYSVLNIFLSDHKLMPVVLKSLVIYEMPTGLTRTLAFALIPCNYCV